MERWAVVTGASSGIGRATAIVLARRGWQVVAAVRDVTAAPRAPRITAAVLDVTDADAVARLAKDVERRWDGRLHGLVNAAGSNVSGPLELIAPSDLRRQLEVNLVGLHSVTRAVLPALRRGRGRVVNVGSLSGHIALPFYGPYAAAKYALEAYTEVLRHELAGTGVDVVLVEPGAIRSGIWRDALESAERVVGAAPAPLREHYEPMLAAVRGNALRLQARARPPASVARAIVRALEDPRPRARYRAGYEMQTRALRVVATAPPAIRAAVVRLAMRR